ncbi:hypothetical protein [Mucilaginibacter sp. HD30]
MKKQLRAQCTTAISESQDRPESIADSKDAAHQSLSYHNLITNASLYEIWYPEWEHFKILKTEARFYLLDEGIIVYSSPSYDVVKMSLFERFHFYKKDQLSSQV